MKKSLVSMVAGVTFEGRQEILAALNGDETVTLVPEPTNQYDPHAIKVMAQTSLGLLQVGYVPKGIAAVIPDPVNATATMLGVVNGFYTDSNLGLRIRIEFEIPDPGFQQALVDDTITLDQLARFEWDDDWDDDYDPDDDDMEPMWEYGDWGDQ